MSLKTGKPMPQNNTMDKKYFVEFLFQQYKADKLLIILGNKNIDDLQELGFLYETDNWNIILDILGYPLKPEIGKETDSDIGREWLYDDYFAILNKDYDIEHDVDNIKIELFQHIEYLSAIIEDHKASKDIEPYFQKALAKHLKT